MLLCMFVGTAWGQDSDLPELSTESGIKWYVIKSVRSNKYVGYLSSGSKLEQSSDITLNSLFYVTGEISETDQLYDSDQLAKVKIGNFAAGTNKMAGFNSWNGDGIDWYIWSNGKTDGNKGVYIVDKTNDIEEEDGTQKQKGLWGGWNDSGNLITDYYHNDIPGSCFVFEPKSFDDVKAIALADVARISNLKILISAETKTSLESSINAATTIPEIQNVFANLFKSLDNKSIRFSNSHTDVRAGLNLTVNSSKNGVLGNKSVNDHSIWTLISNGDATFKLYNFYNNVYLSGEAKDDTWTWKTSASNAGHFSLKATGENKVALVANNNMLHQASYWGPNNYDMISWWDLNDPASNWTISPCDIAITREVFDNATEAAKSLPYAIQQAYGLVTDASNYYSNWMSDAEGSYDALLDNMSDTYFHSAYTDDAKAEEAETHYIQANFGTGASVGEFYIYMAPRNANNRPVDITVSGSNDGVTFTPIKDIATTLASSDTYLSEKLGAAGTKYQYIRLTVNSTNTSTKFFTLSELYFFPAEGDTKVLVDAYHGFTSSSITSSEIVSAANSLINAGGVLALSNIKKEIKSVIDANKNNHAATPALGQYTTAGYNALKAAYEASDATQESLEAALAAFKASQVVPVYFITSMHGGYAAGSAILYNGTGWRWAKANMYDRQMWMTIPGYTKADVPVVDDCTADGTFYELCDYLTRTLMRGKKIQIVKIADWDGAYNLQYNANDESLDAAHHAKDDGSLVNWCPGTKDDAQASAWHVEYIGTSSDLANLTDEKIQALAALKTAYDAKAYYKNVVVGNGVGQYKGNKDAIVAELAKAEAVYMKTISQQADMTVEEINAIAKSITDVAGLTLNMPETGFYRVKSLNGNDAKKAGKYWQIGVGESGYTAMEAGTDLAKSIVYIKSNGETYNIVNYVSGLYLNKYSELKPAGTAAESWTIVENSAVVGAYALYAGKDSYCLSDWTGSITYGQKDANAAWTFEPVDVLPVVVTSAGYATLYAPAALTLADGVEAYYVSAKSATSATMTQVTGVIPANTAVVLKAKEGSYDLTIAAEAQAINGNLLTGTVGSELVEEEAYVLANEEKGPGFYKAALNQKDNTAFANKGFKAYLPASSASSARFISFDFGTETAIENIEGAEVENAVVYDLSGRRVQKAQKGVFIVNGKVVIK